MTFSMRVSVGPGGSVEGRLAGAFIDTTLDLMADRHDGGSFCKSLESLIFSS
jgi:hypothetical protein